jgi:hypothetical protein
MGSLLVQESSKVTRNFAVVQNPIVVPLVFYNGRRGWSGAREVSRLIEILPAGPRRYAPQLRYLLVFPRSSAIIEATVMRSRIWIGVAILLPLLLGAGGAPGLSAPLPDAKIVVLKSLRSLQLFSQGRLVRVYKIGLGSTPVGPKRRQGDRRTPEGMYRICLKNPRSQ